MKAGRRGRAVPSVDHDAIWATEEGRINETNVRTKDGWEVDRVEDDGVLDRRGVSTLEDRQKSEGEGPR